MSENQQYITIKVFGEVDGSIAMEYIYESHHLAAKHGISKFLVDVTEAVNVETAAGNFNFADRDIREIPDFLDRQARVANLVAPDDHSHDFIETVFKNRGYVFRIFRDRKEALEFLEVDG